MELHEVFLHVLCTHTFTHWQDWCPNKKKKKEKRPSLSSLTGPVDSNVTPKIAEGNRVTSLIEVSEGYKQMLRS